MKTLTLAAAALVVFACLSFGQTGAQKVKSAARPPAKLSTAQKKLIVQGKTNVQIGGLTDYAQVSVLKPIVEGKAWLSLSNAGVDFVDGHAKLGGFAGRFNMAIQVLRPGKIHLVSFYLDTVSDQTLRIEARRGMFLSGAMIPLKTGPRVASHIFTPEETGRHSVTIFAPGSNYTYYVFSAECTVVD